MNKYHQQKYNKEYRCPPMGTLLSTTVKIYPPVEEEKKDPPKWYLS